MVEAYKLFENDMITHKSSSEHLNTEEIKTNAKRLFWSKTYDKIREMYKRLVVA